MSLPVINFCGIGGRLHCDLSTVRPVCRPGLAVNAGYFAGGRRISLLDALKNAHVIRYRCTAHVEDSPEMGVLHLQVAG